MEISALHQVAQFLAGRRQHAHVQAQHLAIGMEQGFGAQTGQQPFLLTQRQLMDGIEEQGATIGRRQLALVAEQQVGGFHFGQHAAVETDERPRHPSRHAVQGSRHQFLAAAALPQDQHGLLARPQARQLLAQFPQWPALAQQFVLVAAAIADAAQSRDAESASQQALQARQVHRQGHGVEEPLTDELLYARSRLRQRIDQGYPFGATAADQVLDPLRAFQVIAAQSQQTDVVTGRHGLVQVLAEHRPTRLFQMGEDSPAEIAGFDQQETSRCSGDGFQNVPSLTPKNCITNKNNNLEIPSVTLARTLAGYGMFLYKRNSPSDFDRQCPLQASRQRSIPGQYSCDSPPASRGQP
ncbi:hypothetical protein D9M72_275730 [compost metagenome]